MIELQTDPKFDSIRDEIERVLYETDFGAVPDTLGSIMIRYELHGRIEE